MLDWLLSLIALVLLFVVAGALLLITTDLDRHDPPAWAIAVATVIVSAWLPGWFVYTVLAWSSSGQTLGMASLGISIVATAGGSTGVRRATVRALLQMLFGAPLLFSPLLLGADIALGAESLTWIQLVPALLVVGSALACLMSLRGHDGQGWYDRLSRTRVLLQAERSS